MFGGVFGAGAGEGFELGGEVEMKVGSGVKLRLSTVRLGKSRVFDLGSEVAVDSSSGVLPPSRTGVYFPASPGGVTNPDLTTLGDAGGEIKPEDPAVISTSERIYLNI